MRQGDLVHIPQGVTLFGFDSAILDKTEKPTVGVFLEETTLNGWLSGTYTIYALGREAVVKKRHVYPMGENNGPS
ncbi:MAG TPA: hypothetical protein EYN67_10575 [Flavobacteriales bacterium]|nr:hypothetical protein [Flavobacteriales bacterium]